MELLCNPFLPLHPSPRTQTCPVGRKEDKWQNLCHPRITSWNFSLYVLLFDKTTAKEQNLCYNMMSFSLSLWLGPGVGHPQITKPIFSRFQHHHFQLFWEVGLTAVISFPFFHLPLSTEWNPGPQTIFPLWVGLKNETGSNLRLRGLLLLPQPTHNSKNLATSGEVTTSTDGPLCSNPWNNSF